MKQDEKELAQASRKIKSVVIELSDKLNQQEFLIESIGNETDKNRRLMLENMNKFERVMEIMSRDPRNKIILSLFVTALMLTFYLIY
jgi:hypothetical protein